MPDTRPDMLAKNLEGINLPELEARLKSVGANFDGKYKVMPTIAGNKVDGDYGVEETLDVVAVILLLIKAFIMGGLQGYLAALIAIPNAVIGFNKVALELKDLDEKDVQSLIDYVIQNFPTLPDKVAQALVNHAIKAMYHIYESIRLVVSNSEDPLSLNKNVAPSKETATK